MTETADIAPVTAPRWGSLDVRPEDPGIVARCNPNFLQQAITHLGDIKVVRADLITSGRYKVPPPLFELPPSPLQMATMIEGLPHFCDVGLELRRPGGHVTTITIWLPLNWNGRFLGTAGGGNRTENGLGLPEIGRVLGLPTALRSGFATAMTDGGNKDRRFVEWGLKQDTREIDWELTENWVHRSTHEMTVIGKAVTEAVYGTAPKYSYFAGCSGGGRQALMEAQRHPEDYDGIWSSDPAINWTKFIPAEIWPPLVMKEHGTILPPAKLNAFRAAAVEACDGLDGLQDGIIGAFDPCDFDPRRLIGHSTDAGPITAVDAEVMAKIWQGPRTRTGDFLWYGLHPGTNSWGSDAMPIGLCVSVEADGKRQLVPFSIAEGYIRAWLVKDPNWDWRSLTLAEFEKLFERSVQDFADLATDDPDLSAFRDRGGKLILSHGASDPVIPALGSVDYYRRVIDTIGSEEGTQSFARLFFTEGDGHGAALDPGPGLDTAGAMTALMQWVENGAAPAEIVAATVDMMTGKVKATRPAYAYPLVPQYRGGGDPNEASSFVPVHFSLRAAGRKRSKT